MMMTNMCNLSCPNCINKFEADDLDVPYLYNLNSIQDDIDILSVFDSLTLEISGGEPTLHPAFNEIIDILDSALDCKFTVMTNMCKVEKLYKLPVSNTKIVPSIHYEYRSDALIDDIVELSKTYTTTVSLALDPYFKDQIESDLEYFIANGVSCVVQPQCDAQFDILDKTGYSEDLIRNTMPDHIQRAFLNKVHGTVCRSNLLELRDHKLYWGCTGDIATGDVDIICPKTRCLCGVESILTGDLNV
jgi:organic radical activating enzyme